MNILYNIIKFAIVIYHASIIIVFLGGGINLKQINKKIGIGSISLLLCIMGIIFSFNFGNRVCYGDVILKYMGLNPWSNGDNGTHYTLLYSLIFFIVSGVNKFLSCKISLFIIICNSSFVVASSGSGE